MKSHSLSVKAAAMMSWKQKPILSSEQVSGKKEDLVRIKLVGREGLGGNDETKSERKP